MSHQRDPVKTQPRTFPRTPQRAYGCLMRSGEFEDMRLVQNEGSDCYRVEMRSGENVHSVNARERKSDAAMRAVRILFPVLAQRGLKLSIRQVEADGEGRSAFCEFCDDYIDAEIIDTPRGPCDHIAFSTIDEEEEPEVHFVGNVPVDCRVERLGGGVV